jgi:hypothetical protein
MFISMSAFVEGVLNALSCLFLDIIYFHPLSFLLIFINLLCKPLSLVLCILVHYGLGYSIKSFLYICIH